MLAECPEYIGLRMRIFGKPILYMDEIRTYSIDKVLRFARSEFLNYQRGIKLSKGNKKPYYLLNAREGGGYIHEHET